MARRNVPERGVLGIRRGARHIVIVCRDDYALGAELTTVLGKINIPTLRASSLAEVNRIIEMSGPDAVAVQVGADFPRGLAMFEQLQGGSFWLIALAQPEETLAVRQALELGADDYLTALPFPINLFESRLAAVRRRLDLGHPDAETVRRVGSLTIDLAQYRAFIGGIRLTLTPTEFRLLAVLVENAGRVLSARQLIQAIREEHFSQSDAQNLTRVYIRRLRVKIHLRGDGPRLITVRGFGYMLDQRGLDRATKSIRDRGK